MSIDKKRIAAVVALEACCDRLTAVTGQLSGWGGACHVRIDHSSQPANGSGLQWSTIRNIALAWVLTRPVAIVGA